MKAIALILALSIAALAQVEKPELVTASITMYYPNGTVEKFQSDIFDLNSAKTWPYNVREGCVTFGKSKDDLWSTFCGTFKLTRKKVNE